MCFSQDHRQHGPVNTGKILQVYKVGDIVDIVVNGSIHKGMPYKIYHGRSGVVWNVSKRAVGVEVNKQKGNRIICKRIHVRIEHVQHSKSRSSFLERIKINRDLQVQAKKDGVKICTKRQNVGPRASQFVKAPKIELVVPMKFVGLYQGQL